MDKAVQALLQDEDLTIDTDEAEPRRAWPLRPERLAVVQLWRERDRTHVAAAKGAPEAVFRLCRLPQGEIDRLHQVVQPGRGDGHVSDLRSRNRRRSHQRRRLPHRRTLHRRSPCPENGVPCPVPHCVPAPAGRRRRRRETRRP